MGQNTHHQIRAGASHLLASARGGALENEIAVKCFHGSHGRCLSVFGYKETNGSKCYPETGLTVKEERPGGQHTQSFVLSLSPHHGRWFDCGFVGSVSV